MPELSHNVKKYFFFGDSSEKKICDFQAVFCLIAQEFLDSKKQFIFSKILLIFFKRKILQKIFFGRGSSRDCFYESLEGMRTKLILYLLDIFMMLVISFQRKNTRFNFSCEDQFIIFYLLFFMQIFNQLKKTRKIA